ncbi:MAG TPA: cytochrome c [Blastocatellia bacterium]|nr:cytochrome c [Blastocatellia bacterium]
MRFSIKGLKTVVVGAMTFAILALVILFQTSSQAAATTAGDGGETFKAKCVACHGADGTGNTAAGKAMKVRDLTSAEVQGQTDAQLYELIAKGKGKMPAYEKTLGADLCKALVAYIRTLKQ